MTADRKRSHRHATGRAVFWAAVVATMIVAVIGSRRFLVPSAVRTEHAVIAKENLSGAAAGVARASETAPEPVVSPPVVAPTIVGITTPEPVAQEPVSPRVPRSESVPSVPDPRAAMRGRLAPLSADEILRTTTATYAWASTFQSTGTLLGGWDRATRPAGFNLWFRRPDHFRMEWAGDELGSVRRPYYRVVWENETGAYSFRDYRPVVSSHESLRQALGGLAGILRGSPGNIPSLLKAGMGFGGVITQMRGPTLLGEEEFEGIRCWRIRGAVGANGALYDLWIGCDEFLVRRIYCAHFPHSVQDEIHRNIRLNAEIPDEIFHPTPAMD